MALKMRMSPGEDGRHISFCRLCEALCGLSVEVSGGRIVRIGPDHEHPVSRGHICVKGSRMVDVVHDPDRVLHPLRRKGGAGEFEPVGWDEALDDIARRLAEVCDNTKIGLVAKALPPTSATPPPLAPCTQPI